MTPSMIQPQPPAAASDPPTAVATAALTIDSGDCFVSLSFDLAFSVDLARAGQLVTGRIPGARIADSRAETSSFTFRPPPLVFDQPADPIKVGPQSTEPGVRCIIHQFGAASFVYRIRLRGSLDELVQLSDRVYDNKLLMADARRRNDALLAAAAPALLRAAPSPLTEDYVVFHFRAVSPPTSPEDLVQRHAMKLAQVLRSEPRELSPQEVADALDGRMSLTPADLTIVDWNAAIILQADPPPDRVADEVPTAGDIRAVLEFANIALLELRFLDDQLDTAMDKPADVASRRVWQRRLLRRPMGAELRQLSELQTDAATLFDAVNNSFKLVGDPYLARLFRLASRQLHLDEWDATIRGRLDTAESIYSKISNFQTTRRMEILEWIIVLLIAFEVVMAFFR
jgi:hypothetical protein